MKIKTRPEKLPRPIKFTLKEENLYDGPLGCSTLKPGQYWLLFTSPVGIQIYTDEQLRAKFDITDIP